MKGTEGRRIRKREERKRDTGPQTDLAISLMRSNCVPQLVEERSIGRSKPAIFPP
jgi:hypothetical protein